MLGEFTYPEVGATVNCATGLPRGYNVSTSRVRVGAPECFEVRSSTDTALEGTEVVMLAGFGPVRVRAPTRVVYVVDEADRRGFAYGTLPGHPESGEELFLVERDEEGTWLEIRAFSRPGRWFTRLAGPIGRGLQQRATERYVESARRAVAG